MSYDGTPPERVIRLLQEAAVPLADYKQKLYRLRRIVAGDEEALYGQGVGVNYDTGASGGYSRAYRQFAPDILMQNFQEGRNNALFKFISVLVKQTAYAFPKIEIQGLPPRLSVLHQHYIKDRLTRCGWSHQNKIALWDYLMCGTGEQYLYQENGRPCIRWADTLDVKFDQVARLPSEQKWWSVTICETFGYWYELFKDSAILQSYADKGDKDRPAWDMPFELEFFYSTFGDQGDYQVYIKLGDDSYEPEPVYRGPNPNYFMDGKERVPFLPKESIFYMAVPSVRLPVGVAEQALPGQIAVWSGIKRLQNIIDRGGAFYAIDKGVLDDDEEDAFQRGMQEGVVKVNPGTVDGIRAFQALQITPTDVEEIQRNLQEIGEQLGASAYSLGAPVKGVKYAKEVGAIQAMGSLAAGDIAKENADCVSRLTRKLVAKGKLYDDAYLRFFSEGSMREFGKGVQPFGPVKEYLEPAADFLVSEDSMRFVPQMQKLQIDGLVMDRAMQVARVMPNAVKKAFERFLTTAGIEDIDAWTEMPQAQPAPGQPQQIDPNAMPGNAVAIQNGAKGGALPS